MDQVAFIREVARRMACDEERADALTFAVLQELSERLTPDEVSHVAAQMPLALRKLWTSLERPKRSVRRIHAAEFVGEVRKIMGLPSEAEARRAVMSVFATLQKLLGSPDGLEGEAWDVMSQLPKDLKKMWIEAAHATEE
ncbi:MAG: DUF2267 domain-containing protein [Candidatus Binataceae bacterium]|jgi:uncharacterized protein (DUF2267 family)